MKEEAPFLTSEWRHLAMVNYEIDPSLLQNEIPSGTELDFFEGKTYVSIVGFLFLHTKMQGISIPFHQNFEEVNLRFYVRHRAKEGWRRGVCFIREIVPRFAISFVARTLYNESYITRPMESKVNTNSVQYRWKNKGRWDNLHLKTSGKPSPLPSGSLEEFIAEHYWGYSRTKDGGCLQYRVDHPSWKFTPATETLIDIDVEALYGTPFRETLSRTPDSSFVADGSAVSVFPGTPL